MHAAEHRLYPPTVARYLAGDWQRDGRRIVFTQASPDQPSAGIERSRV
jgi:hypothetical protein